MRAVVLHRDFASMQDNVIGRAAANLDCRGLLQKMLRFENVAKNPTFLEHSTLRLLENVILSGNVGFI